MRGVARTMLRRWWLQCGDALPWAAMTTARRGRRSETIAARYLKRLGYRILARNHHTRIGEIDIIAEAPDGTIAIVEVKAGQAGSVAPEAHVNAHKQRKLAALARQLMQQRAYQSRLIRFDIIAVEWPARGAPAIRHHIGAFEARGA